MRFEGLHSSPDLVGRRVWLRWDYALDPLETPGDVPDVLLRRKRRDFAFPPLLPGDPYLQFDSAAFPPAPIPGSLAVTDLPDEETFESGLRVTRRTTSVATISAGVPVERQRVVRSIFFDGDGAAVRVRTDLLDADDLPVLEPVYYELDDGSAPDPQTVAAYRDIAVPGELRGTNRVLWDLLPDVYRAGDARPMPEAAHVPGVPETARSGGQLRRFIDVFGVGFDMLRNSADGLRGVRNVFSAPPDYLRLMGRSIGWDPSTVVPLPQQRNEVLTATRLFNVLGTIQSMRALVTHQTGWRSQVAELAQNIARSNLPAARSLYLRRERAGAPGTWRGADDVADIFAFPPGGASGAGSLPAVLLSGTFEPFFLFAGAELTLSVDGDTPGRIRFGPDDFADIGAASAAEVAAVINRAFDDVIATGAGGILRIETVLTGPEASLRVEESRQSLLALSDLPDGRIAPVGDGAGHVRVFYRDRPEGGDAREPHDFANSSNIFQKSWGHGGWRDAVALPGWAASARDLHATALAGAAVWLIWTAPDGLRFAQGTPRAPSPAALASQRAQPFALSPGSQLVLRVPGATEVFTVNAGDFVAPGAATALEVAAAVNAQLAAVTASALADGSLRLTTVAVGDDAEIAVDLSQSTAARALGFAARELRGVGRWDPALDWNGPHRGPPIWNPVAELAATADATGGVRAAWAEHQDGSWQIRQAHWSERVTLATPGGVAQQATPGAGWTVWTTVDGLPSNVIRAVAVDAAGTTWFATNSGLARRRTDGVWTVFTTGDGLISNDVVALAILPNGSVACATPAGLSEIDLADAITNTAASPTTIPSSDVRAVAATGTGELWVGTAAGVARRDGNGSWVQWGAAEGLPALPITAIGVAPGGAAAAASAAGVAVLVNAAWRLDTTAEGLPSNEVRAVAFAADGTLLAATAAGLGRYRHRRWRVSTTADGLPSNDLRCIAEGADGRLLIGTGLGLATGAPSGGWALVGAADGLPSATVVHIHANWSAPVILAADPGGNREPHLAVEAGGETWLLWSHRESVVAGPADDWTLRLRRFDPAAGTWASQQPLTAPPPAGAADRQPSAEPAAGGGFRVFFSTNRTGGAGLAWLTANAGGVPGPVALMPVETEESGDPAAIAGPMGETWLFHRADTPLATSQVKPIAPSDAPDRRSLRVPDTGAVAHRAGARTPVLTHAARHAQRRRFGDPLTYTPEYPDRPDSDLPGSPHLYTRRTLALYMRQAPFGVTVTQEEIARLLQMLNRLKPINLRLRLVIAPDPLTEFLYAPGADIGESWSDVVPVVETIGNPLDTTAVVIPGLDVLLANQLASRSADALDPATLLRRTWFPDLL